jgi:hypothetical protein
MMRNSLAMILIFVLCVNLIHAQSVSYPKVTKPDIAILGTFHFAGSSDLLSLEVGDLTTSKRQTEIETVVKALANYQPTKVVLEYPFGKTRLDSLYQQFLKGNHSISINERQQIGFRLAAKMGHEHIYTADHHLELQFDQLMLYLETEGKMNMFQDLIAMMKSEVMDVWQNAYNTISLREFFILMNADKYDRMNRNVYLQHINKMAADSDHLGSEVVARWWERNFIIMSNIDSITEPGDRIFVLFGQGHTAILKDFYKARTDVNYTDILDYLKN